MNLFSKEAYSSANPGIRAVEYIDPKKNDIMAYDEILAASELAREFHSDHRDSLHFVNRVESREAPCSPEEDDKLRIARKTSGCCSPKVQFVHETDIYTLAMPSDDDDKREDARKHLNTAPLQLPEAFCTGRSSLAGTQVVASKDKSATLGSFKRFLRFYNFVQSSLDSSSKAKGCSTEIESEESEITVTMTEEQKQHYKNVKSSKLMKILWPFPSLIQELKDWHRFQDAQSLLGNVCTATLLVGNRAKVYRCLGTTQWYTAVIISYNENNRQLTVIDDTVLEEHQEDPTLLEMHLLNEGLVESLIEGDVGGQGGWQNYGCLDDNGGGGISRRRPQRSNQRLAAQTAQLSIMSSSLIGVAAGSGSAATILIGRNASRDSSNSSSSSGKLTSGTTTATTTSAAAAVAGQFETNQRRAKSPPLTSMLNCSSFASPSTFSSSGGSGGSRPLRAATAATATNDHDRGLEEPVASKSSTGRYAERQATRDLQAASERQAERNFPSPFSTIAPRPPPLNLVASSSGKGATIDGRNFLSHMLRLEALDESKPTSIGIGGDAAVGQTSSYSGKLDDYKIGGSGLTRSLEADGTNETTNPNTKEDDEDFLVLAASANSSSSSSSTSSFFSILSPPLFSSRGGMLATKNTIPLTLATTTSPGNHLDSRNDDKGKLVDPVIFVLLSQSLSLKSRLARVLLVFVESPRVNSDG